MDRLVAVSATVAVGALIAFQPPVNSQLANRTSILGAAFISTTISALVMAVLAFALGDIEHVRRIPDIPAVYLTGGLIGAVLVSVSLVTVRTLGAGGVVAATIAGQLTTAVIVDQLGILGVAKHAITVPRIAGIVLLAAGTFLVVRY
jgi:transporter family-2 protein